MVKSCQETHRIVEQIFVYMLPATVADLYFAALNVENLVSAVPLSRQVLARFEVARLHTRA